VLFATDARAKSPWAKLSIDEVFRLYETLLANLTELKLRCIVAFARKADFPKEIPALAMQHIDLAANIPPQWTKPFPLGDKQLSIWCAHSAITPLAHYPGFEKVRLWLDPDSTVVDWFSGRRAVKNEVGNIFVDVGPGIEPPKPSSVMPVDTGSKPSILEVADVIAYATQRGKAAKLSPNDLRFKKLMRQINAEQIIFGIAPDGGFGANIPNATMNYKPAE
jgi:hypothetical protein